MMALTPEYWCLIEQGCLAVVEQQGSCTSEPIIDHLTPPLTELGRTPRQITNDVTSRLSDLAGTRSSRHAKSYVNGPPLERLGDVYRLRLSSQGKLWS